MTAIVISVVASLLAAAMLTTISLRCEREMYQKEAPPMTKREPCVWREDQEGGTWETGCKETFCFEWEGPAQHLHRFCPNCGKRIKEIPYKEAKP